MSRGAIVFDPPDNIDVQPASVDVTLGRGFRIFDTDCFPEIDLAEDIEGHTTLVDSPSFWLHPGEFALGCTEAVVKINGDVIGRVEGKSSLGRLGIQVHSTAGYIDPGFEGHVTLELLNTSPVAIKLYVGMKVAQISFAYLYSRPARLYGATGSHYQGQVGPTESRYRHVVDPKD